MRKDLAAAVAVLTFTCCFSLRAQQSPTPSAAASSAAKQTETDEYTRYELLAPETASFKIYYEVTATTPGASSFYNPIRKGSAASDEAVFDSMTGEPLHFEVVSGAEARKDPLMSDADADTNFIKISLSRPVPPEGQSRILILKTYKDVKSYYREGDAIVYNRPLGIKRNKVVLPAGHELVGCNVPSQVLSEPDGRISISFLNPGAGEAPLLLHAKLGAQTGPPPLHTLRGKLVVGNHRSKENPSGPASPSAPIRIATLSISCSNRKHTPSVSTTTTPNLMKARTNISTLSAKAAPFPTPLLTFWIPAKSSPRSW